MKKLLLIIVATVTSLIAHAQVITSSSILDSYQKAILNANSEYCYNADIENGRVTAQYVYRKAMNDTTATQLRPHLKYCYEYDAADRLVSRTKLRWDSSALDWTADSRLDYSYSDDSYTVDLRKWDEADRQYGRPTQKMSYSILPDRSLANVTQ